LQQIPASSIERIEIINNPSAKYDADSEAGIINIVLKKNEDAGTNGAFAVGFRQG
jgi:outer membrane receptor for ferrienterochelin and colicin